MCDTTTPADGTPDGQVEQPDDFERFSFFSGDELNEVTMGRAGGTISADFMNPVNIRPTKDPPPETED